MCVFCLEESYHQAYVLGLTGWMLVLWAAWPLNFAKVKKALTTTKTRSRHKVYKPGKYDELKHRINSAMKWLSRLDFFLRFFFLKKAWRCNAIIYHSRQTTLDGDLMHVWGKLPRHVAIYTFTSVRLTRPRPPFIINTYTIINKTLKHENLSTVSAGKSCKSCLTWHHGN